MDKNCRIEALRPVQVSLHHGVKGEAVQGVGDGEAQRKDRKFLFRFLLLEVAPFVISGLIIRLGPTYFTVDTFSDRLLLMLSLVNGICLGRATSCIRVG